MSGLRLIAASLLVLPVGFVTLAAGAMATALSAAIWLFAYIRNRGSALLEVLLLEIYRQPWN